MYDRVPKPPPYGPKGADRITILEDTDGDGQADRFKDFVTSLNLTTGITFGHGGVYVLQVPYLLFYPDRDRDDVPDADPEVLLTGFGMQDASSVANSLIWGPDGWLYGAQGTTVSANIRGIEFEQAIWRYHPLSKQFELFLEGGSNMWGLDFDQHGNLFASTNMGAYIMWHCVQGAYYWKSFGKHGPLHNPFTFGYFEHVPHEGFRGGHVALGGLFYLADAFPEKYRGKHIAANLLSHDVYWHQVERWGSTFKTRYEGELLISNDTWCVPSDLTLGPDGSVFLADWHDQRTAHPDPDAGWDRTNGRIYEIQWKETPPAPRRDLSKRSSDQLVDLLGYANNWYYARQARTLLAARRDKTVIPRLTKQTLESPDEHLALESLWALYVSGGFDETLAKQLLKHANGDVRRWTVRFLGDEKRVSKTIGRQLIELAATEPDVRVRSQLASTAQRFSAKNALPIIHALLMRKNDDRKDPYLPLQLWWAVERHAMSAVDQVLAIMSSPEAWNVELIRDEFIGRLMRRYAADGSKAGDDACVRLLAAAPDPGERRRLIAALDEGLRDRRRTKPKILQGTLFVKQAIQELESDAGKEQAEEVSGPLKRAIEESWTKSPGDLLLIRLAARAGIAKARRRAIDLAAAEDTPEKDRVAMLKILGQFGNAECVPVLLKLISSSQAEPVRMAAVGAVRRFPDERIGTSLLEGYPRMNTKMRSRIREILFGRPAWATMFLQGVDKGALAADEVSPAELKRIALHESPEMDALVSKHWGAIKAGTPEEKLAKMRKFNNDLRFAKGNPAKGLQIFDKICAKCHQLFGQGTKIGPDLTTSNRKDTEALLVSLVDPSVMIRKEYLKYIVQTKDRQIFDGLIAEQTPGSVTLLVGEDNERITVAREDIMQMKESSVSQMPEGQLDELTPDELRDLFSYLQSESPKETETK